MSVRMNGRRSKKMKSYIAKEDQLPNGQGCCTKPRLRLNSRTTSKTLLTACKALYPGLPQKASQFFPLSVVHRSRFSRASHTYGSTMSQIAMRASGSTSFVAGTSFVMRLSLYDALLNNRSFSFKGSPSKYICVISLFDLLETSK